jgi:hypothetical protein
MGKCKHDGCTKQARFNYPNETSGIRCVKHKLDDMVDVVNKRCEQSGCPTQPRFNYPNERGGIRCSKHKLDGMIDIFNKRCSEPGCKTKPKFNYPDHKQGVYCSKHKLDNMIDVCNKTCSESGCRKQPHFNYPDQGKGNLCSEHKLDGMIDVINPKCSEPGCRTRPNFNYSDQVRGEKCSEHKLDGMIDVINSTCIEPGCNKRPSFNYPGENTYSRCIEHKLNGMSNITKIKCLENGCEKFATYGRLFEHKTHCPSHRLHDEYLLNHPGCGTLNCKERPFYTDKGDNYPRRCENHKLSQDKNVVERPCAKCKLPYIINETTLLCNSCSDFFIKTRDKIKEQRVITFLESNGFKFDSLDRPVEGGCTKYRPDGLIDFKLFEVAVEVDEHQHESYPLECEIIRMIMIHQDFGGKPVIFIRFNPDSYESSGKSINYKEREKILLNLLSLFHNVTELKYPLIVCYLFYDGFDGQVKFKSLDSFSRIMVDVTDPFI